MIETFIKATREPEIGIELEVLKRGYLILSDTMAHGSAETGGRNHEWSKSKGRRVALGMEGRRDGQGNELA